MALASVPLASLAACAAMLAVAVWSDTRWRRIPNRVVGAGAAAAMALALVPGGIGWASALGGMLAGLLALLPLHLLRVMGAGDVKLMAAVGAFTGFPHVLGAVLLALVAGGLLAIGWALYLRQAGEVLRNVRTGVFLAAADVAGGSLPRPDSLPAVQARIPYALAIAAGAAAQAWLGNT